VDGRELFVTTRKSVTKRKPRKKKEAGNNDTPKRGRPRKRADPPTPKTTKEVLEDGVPGERQDEQFPEEADLEEIDFVGVQAEPTVEEIDDISEAVSTYGDDEGGFGESTYDIENSILEQGRDETPLPVMPYHSFHSSSPSSPPQSPVYEEYQVPIPTSSSPAKPSTPVLTSRTVTPRHSTFSEEAEISTVQSNRRRARSRSLSRERRMSFAPSQSCQGLPSTPRRRIAEIPDSEDELEQMEEDQESLTTKSTEVSSLDRLEDEETTQRVTVMSVHKEGMTPVRNWAAELAEDAFRFEKSPSKLVQLPSFNTPRQVTVEDEEENEPQEEDDESGFTNNDISHFALIEQTPIELKVHPQITRLESIRRESPIVITSSPPDTPAQQHYQWKTMIPPQPTSLHPVDADDDISISHLNLSSPQCASPARLILTELGSDVVDISSTSPLAAKRAANILLRTPYYNKVNLREGEDGKIWDQVSAREEGLDLLDEFSFEADDEITEDSGAYLGDNEVVGDTEEEEAEDEQTEEMDVESPSLVRPSRTSQGDWTKVDWKRLEKCLDLTDGEPNDAIDLFMERYIGREREEVELRYKALMVTRRRRALEGRKVEFLLSTVE